MHIIYYQGLSGEHRCPLGLLLLKVISTLYNCSKRIKTVGNLIRGSLRGSKRIKKGEISMKSKEINEI